MDIFNKITEFLNVPSTTEISIGVILAAIATAFGGWTEGMTALAICMIIDYITGLIVAGIFHNSQKTDTGRLESNAGWKGLIRKGVTMLIVLVAAYVDRVIGTTFIRDAVVIGFLVNEVISIIENAGLMGIPVPKAVTNMIELLKKRSDEEADEIISEQNNVK